MALPEVTDLADYVGALPNEPLIPVLLEAAVDMLDADLGMRGKNKCPSSIYNLAIYQLVSELWTRRRAPGGIAQWGPDGQAARISRDAMVSVRPLIARYRSIGAVG